MMLATVLFFMCGLMHIYGRPSIEQNGHENSLGGSIQIPPWPQSEHMYLLPKMFNTNDIINITVDMTKTTVLKLQLISEDHDNATTVLCNVLADTNTNVVTMKAGDNEQEEDITHFLLNDETIFNIWLRRRINIATQQHNVLEIFGPTTSNIFEVKKMDKLRFLLIDGDNVKVNELEFKFA